MASESTAASLPGRTQPLAEHSPPNSPARAPGAKRDLGYVPLKSRGHLNSWVTWGGTFIPEQGGITNSGRQQTARTKDCAGI